MPGNIRSIILLGIVLFLSGCAEQVRVPLPSPVLSVGGARPAVGQGLQFTLDFGDGVWGQEQERAEMVGSGLGASLNGRFEGVYTGYHATRKVRTEDSGTRQSGPLGKHLKGKLLMMESEDGRISAGLHVARAWAQRAAGDVQDEELRAWDLAFPVEYRLHPHPSVPADAPKREASLYAGPRAIVQRIEDRAARESDQGTLLALFLGARARFSVLVVMGELNLAWTPAMELGGIRSESGFLVLPMVGIRLVLPLGEKK